MPTLHRVLSFFDSHRIPYKHQAHPTAYTAREVADVEQISAHMVAKAIVFVSENGYGMAVLPADMAISLATLRDCLGVSRLRLVTETELKELFPYCEVGAMPPLGNGTLYDLSVYMDASLKSQPNIVFNAGTHKDTVQMRLDDYLATVNPEVMHFAIHPELAGV
jgi:Ala-tRNA(Pro) deacylase